MARRRQGAFEDMIDITSAMPWWAGVGLAVVTYVILHSYAGAELVSTSMQDPHQIGSAVGKQVWKSMATLLQYLVPVAFLIGAGISWLQRLKRKDLLAQAAGSSQGSAIAQMSWQEFELLIGEAFRRQGFGVTETGQHGPDGGIDLMLHRAGQKSVVQCKHWKTQQVGVKPVREFYGVMVAEQAASGYFVTSGSFTVEARAFANGKSIELIDGDGLQDLVRGVVSSSVVPVKNTESDVPACPKCGAEMIKRTARKGSTAGQAFWGCSVYPGCRGTRAL